MSEQMTEQMARAFVVSFAPILLMLLLWLGWKGWNWLRRMR